MSDTTTEQNETEQNEAEGNEMDDWAAAMAEQEAAEQATDQPDSESEGDVTPDAAPTGDDTSGDVITGAQAAEATVFKEFSGENTLSNNPNDIDLILDIPVQLTVELGRTKIAIKNLLQLAQGSVVELDGLAGEPMDVLVNGCLIAQGEVVVVNDKFGIRLTDIITPAERIRKINK